MIGQHDTEGTQCTVAHTEPEELEALKLRAALKRSVTSHDEDLKVLYEQVVTGWYPAAVKERVASQKHLAHPIQEAPRTIGSPLKRQGHHCSLPVSRGAER